MKQKSKKISDQIDVIKQDELKKETVRHKKTEQDEVDGQTGREGLVASGGSRFWHCTKLSEVWPASAACRL